MTKENKSTPAEIIGASAQLMIAIGFVVGVIFLIGHCTNQWRSETKENPKHQWRKFSSDYEKPIVADTVKNDWVKDPNISIEKRVILEQILNDIDR